MNSEQAPKPNTERNPLFMSLLAGGLFVAFLLSLIYLSERLENIEEQLVIQPASPIGMALEIREGQTVYVPVYSHIYSGDGTAHLLATTLSIRNSDTEQPIVISSARYYDTGGNLLEEYLDKPVTLGPLQTHSLRVPADDARGGSGANFIVTWQAEQPVYAPIVEAVMIGSGDGPSISFKSVGRPLSDRAN